jgi:hypothetical protein
MFTAKCSREAPIRAVDDAHNARPSSARARATRTRNRRTARAPCSECVRRASTAFADSDQVVRRVHCVLRHTRFDCELPAAPAVASARLITRRRGGGPPSGAHRSWGSTADNTGLQGLRRSCGFAVVAVASKQERPRTTATHGKRRPCAPSIERVQVADGNQVARRGPGRSVGRSRICAHMAASLSHEAPRG